MMESMIRFVHPHLLYLLGGLPILVILYYWSRRARGRSLQRFGNLQLLSQLTPDAGKRKRGLKFTLLIIALAFIILGAANPQIGTKLEMVKREGVDILIALDISNSMRAEDLKPNRLENAKRQISLLLQRLQNDRVGIVVFAGQAFMQLPLTTDYGAAQLFISTIDTDFSPVQGTAIGSAIRLAMKSFVHGEKKHRVIVVISDGEDFEEDALAAAKEAAGDGIVIHTIGMGSPQGVPIPLYQNGAQVGFKKDEDGSTVVTRLNEILLQQVADAGKGKYLRAANRQDELDSLFKEIERMEKKQLATRMFTDYEDRFQYPLAAAFALLLIEFFVSERKLRWAEKWKAFLPGPTKAAVLILLIPLFAYAESDRSLVRQGNRQYDSKQYSEAEVNYRKALEQNTKLREGQFNLGDALYKQGRFEEAENQFHLSSETAADPLARAHAYHNLGNAQLKQKKLEESIGSYKQALKLNPNDQDTKYNLEYARKLIQQQQQQQQQNQQNKDQKKDKDQKQNQQQQKQDQQQDKQDQQKQDQQKQDQKQEDQKQQDQKQQQDKEKQSAQNQQQQKEQDQQQPQKKDQISQQDAERILEALKNEEKNVQKKLHRAVAKQAKVKKDW